MRQILTVLFASTLFAPAFAESIELQRFDDARIEAGSNSAPQAAEKQGIEVETFLWDGLDRKAVRDHQLRELLQRKRKDRL